MRLLCGAWRHVDRGLIALSAALLSTYRVTLGLVFAGACRFQPSCSHYAEEAFRRHGSLLGVWLTLKRLCRCHPFHPGGMDPVPLAGDSGPLAVRPAPERPDARV